MANGEVGAGVPAADLPLIDLRRWRDGDPAERAALAAELDRALRTWGFLLVSGHGVAAGAGERVRAAARRLFALPAEVKGRYAVPVGGRGWLAPGREANSYHGQDADPTRADLKESWTLGREHRTGDPETDARWFAPNVWPAEVPELAGPARAYAEAVRAVNDELLELCAVALGLEPAWFTDRSRAAPHTFNINRYPPRTETGPALEGQFRIAPHTDWGMLTILDRQPGHGGLQIETLDGRWRDAPFVPGALTVNVGDLLARWTGDRWRSTRHRVLPPPAEAPTEELISLIVFLEADVDTLVTPLPGGPGAEQPPVRYGEYLRARTSAADNPAQMS